jgi:hypothetical protein
VGDGLTEIIADLFDKRPRPYSGKVASVQELDPETVYEELDEYVVTDLIRRDLEDIIDRFIESRRGSTENVCGWISGFFGSGKSIFLKVLGCVLANRKLELKSGDVIESASFFLNKNSFPAAYSTILTKQLKVKSIFVNMLDHDIKTEESITKIVYSELLRDSGLSDIPWIAEIERNIKERGLWEKFLGHIREAEGRDWQQVRKTVVRARPTLVKALHAIDPETYTSEELASKSIEDVEKNFQLRPKLLVDRLLERAIELDPAEGRIVILLDEVGLYMDNNPDRLADLNILAESISKFGNGKVWLFVTAQEALEDVVARLVSVADQFAKIRDRFQIMVKLSPENIDTVVKKRLLQKTANMSKLEPLKQLYKAHSGKLWTSALPSQVTAGRDYHGFFTRGDEEKFYQSYPFMPYHIYLMQQVFDILRSRQGPTQALTGRERTVLSVVSAILSGLKERKGLADMPVGDLATFDMVYDAIDEELKAIRAAQQALIGREIAELGKRGEVTVASVAKVIFLLQDVNWFPTTAENITALLYPRIGAERDKLLEDVKKCLDALEEGKWIKKKNGIYRFLTGIERSFEQMVEEKRQELTGAEKRKLIREIAKIVIEEHELSRFVHQGVLFYVKVFLDDEEITTKGHIELRIYSPYKTNEEGLLKGIVLKSRAEPNVIYWLCDQSRDFEDLIEKILSGEKVLNEFKPQSDEERKVVDEQSRSLRLLKDNELPSLFVNATKSGKTIYRGETSLLDGRKDMEEAFKINVEQAVKEVYTEFELAPCRVERDPEDVIAILKWRGGKLPEIYKKLQLVDEQDNILTSRPVATRILARLKDPKLKQEDRTGSALLEHFASPPYGWDAGVVKLVLATLFKNGSVVVISAGKEFDDPAYPLAQEVFRNLRVFTKAEFRIGEEEIPADMRTEASKALSELFGERAQTPEEIDSKLVSSVSSNLTECGMLIITSRYLNLPALESLTDLQKALQEIKSETSRKRRIQAFIDQQRIDVIRRNLKLLKKLKKFDEQGNLEKYKELSRFAQDIAPRLQEEERDEEIKGTLESFRLGLGAQDFMERWHSLLSTYEKLKRRYEKVYLDLHRKRHELLENALKSLETHPAFTKIKGSQKETILRRLTGIDCEAEPPSVNLQYVCDNCKSSLDSLRYHISNIESRKAEIQSILDGLSIDRENKIQRIQFTGVISSLDQLPRVTKRVEELARQALAIGKSVKVKVEEAGEGGEEKKR